MHRLGQHHEQGPAMDRAVLPDHRRALESLRGSDGRDAAGALRARHGFTLLALHGALQVQAHGGPRCQRRATQHNADAALGAGTMSRSIAARTARIVTAAWLVIARPGPATRAADRDDGRAVPGPAVTLSSLRSRRRGGRKGGGDILVPGRHPIPDPVQAATNTGESAIIPDLADMV